MFNNKKKRLALIFAPMILVSCLIIYDANLDVYTNSTEGILVYKDKEFHRGYETHQKYYVNGEKKFKIERLIGKTNNSKFVGFKESVWKIEGKPADEVVFVKGLRIEGVYEIKK